MGRSGQLGSVSPGGIVGTSVKRTGCDVGDVEAQDRRVGTRVGRGLERTGIRILGPRLASRSRGFVSRMQFYTGSQQVAMGQGATARSPGPLEVTIERACEAALVKESQDAWQDQHDPETLRTTLFLHPPHYKVSQPKDKTSRPQEIGSPSMELPPLLRKLARRLPLAPFAVCPGQTGVAGEAVRCRISREAVAIGRDPSKGALRSPAGPSANSPGRARRLVLPIGAHPEGSDA